MMSDNQVRIYTFTLESSWHEILKEELSSAYMMELANFLEKEYLEKQSIYPPKELIFNAFNQTPFNDVQVVLIGQDPYHGYGQAHGLCFSVPEGVKPPPSLENIFKELSSDLQISRPAHGSLLSWAKQGVLLLNATLTVSEGSPLSHQRRGWEQFTDAVVSKLMEREDKLIFVLWGKSAQKKCRILTEHQGHHYVLTAPHPSPLSAYQGFFGCRHFSKINELLISQEKAPIDWVL
ncbi:MAG: uracil-DNA glycosylase [Parachlamydiaceae bacterium]|nr:uracil-DNA glycosylase [Parachlamydiaceae bacterium]